MQVDIQQVVNLLGSKVGQLEVDKAILQAQVNQLQQENEQMKLSKEEVPA